MESLRENRFRVICIAATVCAEVHLVHVGVLGDDDFIRVGLGKNLRGNGGKGRDRRDSETGAVCQALRDGRGDTHADERTGAVAEHDSVQVARLDTAL